MSKRKQVKKQVTVKIEPLRGKFFDLKPAASGRRAMIFSWVKEYSRFVVAAVFIFVTLILVSTYVRGKEVVLESSILASLGYESLQEGAKHLIEQDGGQAFESFLEAQKQFEALEKNTAFLTRQADHLVSQSHYLETADTLLEAALIVAEIGQELSVFVESVHTFPQQFLQSDGEGMMTLVHEKKTELDHLIHVATTLQQELASIELTGLPEALEEKVRLAQRQVGLFLAVLLEFDHYSDQLLTLLGDRVPHRYLILFQNNHEMRPTGGFIGSYMIVDVNDGKITKMESKDVYDSDGQLAKVIPPPPGIDQVADRWFMRDANYSPDFPTSAQQIMWFLEASRGPSVDTVIAITQAPVEGMLEMMGEIEVPGIDTPINSENFSRLISFYTEAKLSESNTPKQLLFDLIPVFKERLTNFEEVPQSLAFIHSMIEQGHFQAYSKDASIQALFEQFNVTGKLIPPTDEVDFLSVITTSIGGNKSDNYIKTGLVHQTSVNERGQLVDTLTIKKDHTYGMLDRLAIQSLAEEYGVGELTEGTLQTILGEGDNLDYMRVYVPLGSQLTSAEGLALKDIQVSEDLGYTVFGFVYGPVEWGESKTVELTYELPFKLHTNPIDTYRFVAQKQAGLENVTLKKQMQLPEALVFEEVHPPVENGEMEQVFEGPFMFLSSIRYED